MTVDVHYIWCLMGIIFNASKIGADRRVMGIASAFEAAFKMGAVFLSAPNDLYPWNRVDQGRSGSMRSAVDLHP